MDTWTRWLKDGLAICVNEGEIEKIEKMAVFDNDGYCPLCDEIVYQGDGGHSGGCPFLLAQERVNTPKTFSVDVSATAEDVITVLALNAEEASKIALAQLHARLSDAGLGVDNLTVHNAVEIKD